MGTDAEVGGRAPRLAAQARGRGAAVPPAAEDRRREEGGPDADSRTVAATQAAEVRALRARLRAVEAALGLLAPPAHRAPPSLPELARRLAVLERRAGVVPGLVPLPGTGTAAAPGAVDPPTAPRARQGWRDCGQAALAAALLVALVVWLLRPATHAGQTARPTPVAPTVAARATAAPRAVPAAPSHGVAEPSVLACETPYLLDVLVPCGTGATLVPAGAPVPPGVWGRDGACPTVDAGVCWDGTGAPATPARP